ncbi:MAG: glycoside hydrolase family 88 protein [Phycisphaerae bacterium]|nr:glycoside hydrolase family 88 protein [Phycisphaerae bacterium]
MHRRDFMAGAVCGLPVLQALLGSNSKVSAAETSGESLIEKVKMAMLCMQRASWEQGVAMQGLMEIDEKELVVIMAGEAILRSNKDGRLAMLGSDTNVTDPGSNGPGVLYAYKVTGDEKFKKAADTLYKYYKSKAPKTEDGILRHLTSATQVWSDSMFMAPPFLALMGDYDEAVKQVDGYRKYLWNSEKKLFSHMWDDRKKEFKRSDLWGGGNGWSAAALAQIIEVLPKEKESDRTKLIGYEKELLDGCISFMRSDGLFYDVIDKPDTFIDANLSQMLAYSIYKGVKAGWLEDNYLKVADKMRAAAHSKIDKYGVIHDVCGSPFFDRSGTSTEAQAFFLMMEGAYAKLKG